MDRHDAWDDAAWAATAEKAVLAEMRRAVRGLAHDAVAGSSR